ncbi:hypothetical protein TNCV_1456601 [Trichonephila clavipes]|nr:hypothetical protein TNCV_1456601 [Trichonephila clavipes]
MVYTCVVPNCNSNYKDTGTVQMFGFPKEDSLRKKWIQAISRKDFAPSQSIRSPNKIYVLKNEPKQALLMRQKLSSVFAIATLFLCHLYQMPFRRINDSTLSINSLLAKKAHYDIQLVCELHFSDDAIRRYTEAYNEKTGEKICVPLKLFRLQNFAVPTIFTDFPTYLSNSGNPARECAEQRLQRLENEHLQRSIQASIISKEEFEKKKSVTSFPELVECLNAEELQDIWTVVCKNDLVVIIMLDTIISPVIKALVIINKDLHLTIHIVQTKIDQLGKSTNFM